MVIRYILFLFSSVFSIPKKSYKVIPKISHNSGTRDDSGQTPSLIHFPIAGFEIPSFLDNSAWVITFSTITKKGRAEVLDVISSNME